MRWTPILLLLGFTSGTVAAPIPKEVKVNNDAQRILGKWQSEFLSTNGEDKQPVANTRFRFEADGKCMIMYGCRDNRDPDCEYSLETIASPRRMKWLNGTDMRVYACLYELDEDSLKIAFSKAVTETPANLDPAQNTSIYYLKRIKE